MAMTLFGAVAVAILAACVAFVVRRLTGINARWIIPASAGAAMLGFTMWNDYTWFSRVAEGLPETVAVAETFTTSHFIQPWTMVAPMVSRFQAVDLGARRRSGADPDVVRAPVHLVARYQPTLTTVQAFHCARGLRADAVAGGLPAEEDWITVGTDDPLLRTACAGSWSDGRSSG